jgi:hypothetical protein
MRGNQGHDSDGGAESQGIPRPCWFARAPGLIPEILRHPMAMATIAIIISPWGVAAGRGDSHHPRGTSACRRAVVHGVVAAVPRADCLLRHGRDGGTSCRTRPVSGLWTMLSSAAMELDSLSMGRWSGLGRPPTSGLPW